MSIDVTLAALVSRRETLSLNFGTPGHTEPRRTSVTDSSVSAVIHPSRQATLGVSNQDQIHR